MGHFYFGGFGWGLRGSFNDFWLLFTPQNMQRYHQKKHVWVGNLPVELRPPRKDGAM